MSTKTTLKRIALVAASALGFGLMSVVPAQAAFNNADLTISQSAATVGTTGSVTAYVTVNFEDAGDKAKFNLAQITGTSNAASWRVIEDLPFSPGDYTLSARSGSFATALEITSVNGTFAYFALQLKTSGATAADVFRLQGDTDDIDVVGGYTGVVSNLFTLTVGQPDVDGVDTPWRIVAGQTNVKSSTSTVPAAITASSVVATGTDVFKVEAIDDTIGKTGAGSYRYVEVTGSTIAAVTGGMVLDGLPNSATRAYVPLNGVITGANVWVNAATAGTVTIKFVDRSFIVDAFPFLPFAGATPTTVDTVLQTVTLTVAAAPALSAQQSTSYIHALHSATTGVATSQSAYGAYVGNFENYDCSAAAGTQACDFSILAPLTANGTTAKAVIQVNLKDAAGVALETSALPAIGASIAGPGTLSISTTADGTDSVGRSLSATAAPDSTFYINVFSDGTGGTSTVSILVGGSVWATKTLSFYSSTVSSITATQGRFVLKAGETAGCATSLTACDGTTVAKTVAASITAKDANGIPVPFVKYTETSSDATVLTGNAVASQGDFAADYLGTTWFQVPAVPNTTSGKTATMTYTAGTLTQVLTYAIGGDPVSASLAIAAGANIGEAGVFTINVKDASGNKIYDSDHTLAISTNLQTTISGTALKVVDGKGTVNFYNPVVPGTVTVTGLVSGLLPVSGSFSVASSAADAAVDAALEAIDAANAATDAANLAAEAADAATVAAEEARDAADAATAAVEALASEVATLIANLKAQLVTLSKTVAKIAKKVKA